MALLTFVIGFAILGYLAYRVYAEHPTVPRETVAADGAVLMGVYGMLAIGFFLFVAAYFVPRDSRTERAMKWSFWSLNGGLAWMVCVNLFPIGALQFNDALVRGYWHVRSPEFFARGDVRALEWLRLPGDVVFIVGGILPLVYLAARMVANRNRPGTVPAHEAVEPLAAAR